MEVHEGQVRITQTPFVLINDKPLAECPAPLIAREIQALCKKIAEQRQTIDVLQKQLRESFDATD